MPKHVSLKEFFLNDDDDEYGFEVPNIILDMKDKKKSEAWY